MNLDALAHWIERMSPEKMKTANDNWRHMVDFWRGHAGLSEERAAAMVEQALDQWLTRVRQVCGSIPDDLIEEHCATYLQVLVNNIADQRLV